MPRNGSYLYEIDLGLGASLFESHKQYTTNAEHAVPVYAEIESPDQLRKTQQIVDYISKIDWSFRDDKTGFLTHNLHPYPAKYIPQIPGRVISRLSLRGELVFDPFGGSGTTALEAVRLGRRALSIDANPIGTLIGKVKTSNLNKTAATDLNALRCVLVTRANKLPNEPDKLCVEYECFIPEIPNIDKWFPLSSRGELALIRARIDMMDSEKAKNIARLALSRIILPVSFQDSETRYASVPRKIPVGESINRFLIALDDIIRNVIQTQSLLRYGVCDFITANIRTSNDSVCKPDLVDLIVTSPPYGNANDYHLYHRFRLLWLGYSPRELAKVEIGSHLRHQKEATGFDGYLLEMRDSLQTMFKTLRAGRYAVLVVGDAVYKKVIYKGAESLSKVAKTVGFETLCIVERKIHNTKRSFITAGRRATTEKLLLMRKPTKKTQIWLESTPYKLWPYEKILRKQEIKSIFGNKALSKSKTSYCVSVDSYTATMARRLVFTHGFGQSATNLQPTWQSILENGFSFQPSTRKDPKYATHGLHPYKGKFYPQLAKGLMNLCNLKPGSCILDPFCGSGTTLLEGYLNGHHAYGCDMHPLAAKMARAKVGILDINPDIFRETVGTLVKKIEQASSKLPANYEQFNKDCIEEIENWFPQPVIKKIGLILRAIRHVSDGVLRDFLETVLSSIIRNVSQQDPKDLRIRKRKNPIKDADVFSLYIDALDTQYKQIEHFWSVRGYSPSRLLTSSVVEGDSRRWKTFELMGITDSSMDFILTSPPYATALPYIDTDRLSLLILFGMHSSKRRPVEYTLVGTREIITQERKRLEDIILQKEFDLLPPSVGKFLIGLHNRISDADVGFRRKNMPALLLQFFLDMETILQNCFRALKPKGEAMIVIGDNKMRVNGEFERISTTDYIRDIALKCGFDLLEQIDISVTTENLVHVKNAITKNIVLRLRRS